MSLYIETIFNYLKNEIEKSPHKSQETRFIIQSLPPEESFKLFSLLESFELELLKNSTVKSYLKVASGLWSEWLSSYSETELKKLKQSHVKGAILDSGNWIDLEDKLTWYRNRTVVDEDVDLLNIILIGLNHTTDQGGLSDFHLVDETRLWHSMGNTFSSWIEHLCLNLDVDITEFQLEELDALFIQLFEIRPLQLSKLSQFLHSITSNKEFHSYNELLEEILINLPYWGIPLVQLNGANIKGKSIFKIIHSAQIFISHQRYKTKTNQKKDWKKIEEQFTSDMAPKDKNDVECDFDEYIENLQSFIFKGQSESKEYLQLFDIVPLIKILDQKEPKESKAKKTIKQFNNTSYEAFLMATMETISAYIKPLNIEDVIECFSSIKIELVRFDHDLISDELRGTDKNEVAKDLIKGCLGGIDTYLSRLDLRLPIDREQLLNPYEMWEKQVEVCFDYQLDNLQISTSRKNPNIQFKIIIESAEGLFERIFRWNLKTTSPERVLFETSKHILQKCNEQVSNLNILPAFKIPEVAMSALYYAADEDEANRLVTQSLADLEICNLIDDIENKEIDNKLKIELKSLIDNFFSWLNEYIHSGFYTAAHTKLLAVLNSYVELSKLTLDKKLIGSEIILQRLYKSFFIISEESKENDNYLSSALAWGLSPCVLELFNAHHRYLTDGFPEVYKNLIRFGQYEDELERLIELSKIHRPLAALVTDQRSSLSSDIKSFGLLHYLGNPPQNSKSLAVQTLLRESDVEEDENVKEVIKNCPERKVVNRVLDDYKILNPHASDGLSILAVNISELQTILSGIDLFLHNYLNTSSNNWPAFNLNLTVYSTTSSPLAIETRLNNWKEYTTELYKEKSRTLKLNISHQYTTFNNLKEIIKNEKRDFDITFLFHFLKEGLVGKEDPAIPFEYDFGSCSYFPICEYPRPIKVGLIEHRQTLISNRQLRVQTRHSDMSARLRFNTSNTEEYLIYGEVDYEPWKDVIKLLHEKCFWLACIDPFIDKELLNSSNGENRNIVGFTSGLGSYGELNLTISTERDTLDELSKHVTQQINRILPYEPLSRIGQVSSNIVSESEKIIGLSSIRAATGGGEKIREVLGFAAINKVLDKQGFMMEQLLPLDSFQHWFASDQYALRPDLLQISLEITDEGLPLIYANIIECKVAQKNPNHVAKALDQIQDGLHQLANLFAPKSDLLDISIYDRKYWWAQLHRALTTRSIVDLSESDWQKLDRALEFIIEGQYEIQWNGSIFTFWTDSEESFKGEYNQLNIQTDSLSPCFKIEEGFAVQHFEFSCDDIISLFEAGSINQIKVKGQPSIKFSSSHFFNSKPEITPEVTPEITPEIAPEVTLEIAPEVTPEIAPEVTPEIAPEVTPEITPEVIPEISSNKVSFSVPEKILLGTRKSGAPVYWHFGHSLLPNRHLLIFGTSGSGKTYGIQCFLAELACQNVNSIIVDYTDGFLPNQVEPLFHEKAKLKNHFVVTEKLPLNPFRRQTQIIDPSIPAIEETAYQVATRIESIFSSIFQLGDQQKASLIRVLQDGLERNDDYSLSDVIEGLRADDSQYGESLANKLEPLIKAEPFSNKAAQAWDKMLLSNNEYVHVMQLKGLAREIQKMVTEFALWDLWDYAQSTGSKNRPIPVVLDEIQNLDHSSDSPIDKMLREGRKFGLSMILATQTTSQFNQEQRDRLFQAGHKLFFKPASTEVDKFAQILAQATSETKQDWSTRLSKLEKGQCWSLGPVVKSDGSFKEEAVLLTVTSFEQRKYTDE